MPLRPLLTVIRPVVILLLLLGACALTGCSDTASGDSAGQHSPQSATGPDLDGDGITDSADDCPTEQEDHRWSNEAGADGCPDGIDELMTLAVADIGGFWAAWFKDAGIPYEGPEDVVAYDSAIKTGCGEAVPNNAFYCGVDHTIYYHRAFLDRQLAQVGDFGPVYILAHEWGHLVQANTGVLSDARRYSIQNELQADCFAGVYSRDADSRKILDEGDLDEAVTSLLNAGDPRGVPWYDEAAHGSPRQRVSAFADGFDRDFDACLDY